MPAACMAVCGLVVEVTPASRVCSLSVAENACECPILLRMRRILFRTRPSCWRPSPRPCDCLVCVHTPLCGNVP